MSSAAQAERPTIVVGFDGSDDAVAALEFACDEANGRGAALNVVHAVDDSMLNSAWGIVFDVDAYRRTGERLVEQARGIAADCGITDDRFIGDVVVGQPGTVLLEASERASVVVVGRRAEPGEDRMFVGSTGVALAGQGSTPLIVVSEVPARHEPFGLVSVAIDSSQTGSPAVEWGFRRAGRLGARLEVVSIVTRPRGRFFALNGTTDEQMEAAQREATVRLEALLVPFREQHPGVPCTVSVQRAESLVEELVAVSTASDFLILGVRTGFPTYTVGGSVRALMTHAQCPLGIIRHR